MWATAVYLDYLHTIRWGPIELSWMDTIVHRNLSKYRAHQRNASVISLYIYRNNGGCGLTSLQHAWEQVVAGMVEYLCCLSEPWLREVLQHNIWRCANLKPNLVQDAMGILSRYDLPLPWEYATQDTGDQTNHITQQLKCAQQAQLVTELRAKHALT